MERTLDELKQRSQDAIQHSLLIELAKTSASPNAAYDMALEEQFSPRQAKSCRFLAMILRDYGAEALAATITEFQENDLSADLACAIARIKLVEQVAGYPLLVYNTRSLSVLTEAPVRLAKYLERFPVTGIVTELQLGASRIELSSTGLWFPEKDTTSYLLVGTFWFHPSDHHPKQGRKYERLTHNVSPGSIHELRKIFLAFLVEDFIGCRHFGIRSKMNEPVSLVEALCQEAVRSGEVLPPNPEIFLREGPMREWPMNRGDAEVVERRIAEKRAEAVAAGVKERFLALFDHEASICIERTKHSFVAPEILRESSLGGHGFIGRTNKGRSNHHFLLFCSDDTQANIWQQALEVAGYAGARFEWSTTPEPVLGYQEAEKYIVLLHDHIGYSSKREWVTRAVSEVERVCGSQPHIFVWDGKNESQFQNLFAAFLSEHCPLS